MSQRVPSHGWLRALMLLIYEPGIFLKKVSARLIALMPFPRERCLGRVGKIRFDFDFSMGASIRHMRFGCYEPEMTRYICRHLKAGDVFIDAGANIGYFSALALDRVGPSGSVHSFEPVPKYFERLKRIADLNPGAPLHISQQALGDRPGLSKIWVAGQGNFGWNTLVPGFMETQEVGEVIDVPVIRLDDYIETHVCGKIALIKIDVEGYEFPLLLGLEKYFLKSENRPAILCEVAPKAYEKLDTDIGRFESWMRRFGYEAFSLEGTGRRIPMRALIETANIVFEYHDEDVKQCRP